MLRLSLKNTPDWLDLGHGVRVLVEPMSTAMMIAARRDPQIAALGVYGGDAIEALNNDDFALVMAKAVARIAIKDWEGVGDADGNPITVTPERISALLEVWPLFEAFQTKYVNSGFLLDAEKNASAPLPTGNSAGARSTARPAKGPARTARKP
jgi:hypothetical protein